MSAVQWFSGPPPAVGWWPVPHKYFRWWDGEFWSYLVADHESSATASESAAYKAESQGSIIWRHWSIEIDGTDGMGAHE